MVTIPVDDDDQIDYHLCDKVDENGLYVICNSVDGTYPSEILGIGVFLGIFLAFIACSGACVAVILYCNKRAEQARRDQISAVPKEVTDKLTKKLKAKPWSNDLRSSFSGEATERTLSMPLDFEEDDISTDLSLEQHLAANIPIDAPPLQQKDGSMCSLCSEPFQPEQPVYQSNNPACLHWHHKACMDKWLQFQNTCPTCNQPFVLQTV